MIFGGLRARWAAAGWTWLGLQIAQWWLPYGFGVHPLTGDGGQWYFDGGYDQTLHPLPAQAGRVVPDAEHLVQQTLSLAAAVLATRAAGVTGRRVTFPPLRKRMTAE